MRRKVIISLIPIASLRWAFQHMPHRTTLSNPRIAHVWTNGRIQTGRAAIASP